MSGTRPLTVPMRVRPDGTRVLWTASRPDGTRVGVAFTSPTAMRRTLGGPGWSADALSPHALRALLSPLGIGLIVVDPDLAAPRLEATAPASA